MSRGEGDGDPPALASGALVVAAGHELRLRALEEQARALIEARAAADALLAEWGPLLAPEKPPASAAVAAPPLPWASVIAINRAEVAAAGLDPDAVAIDDLFAPAVLAAIEAEWRAFSAGLDARLTQAATDALIADLRQAAIAAIVGPLGLGRVAGRRDKTGGGVLTLPTAEAVRRRKIRALDVADPTHARAYAREQNRSQQSQRNLHASKYFRVAKLEIRAGVADAYRRGRLDQRQLDHVLPASQLDRDPAVNFYLGESKHERLIHAPENLAWTSATLNRSKGAKDPRSWARTKRADGATNMERFRLEPRKIDARTARADQLYASVLRSERVSHFGTRTLAAGGKEALETGLREAIGTLFVELVAGVLDELTDLLRTRRDQRSLLDDLRVRTRRVVDRIVAASDQVVAAFSRGAIAGLLSAIVTAVINAVVTTSKRLVRVIRDGALGLVRALALLVRPPPGMDLPAAAHEAAKLLGAALVATGGILVEEAVEKAILLHLPPLAPFAPCLTSATVGLATGLGAVLLVVLLDQLDLFGVIARERGEARIAAMRARTDQLVDALVARGALPNRG